MKLCWMRLLGLAIVMVMAGFIGHATEWYVAPCIIVMLFGQNIYETATDYSREKSNG